MTRIGTISVSALTVALMAPTVVGAFCSSNADCPSPKVCQGGFCVNPVLPACSACTCSSSCSQACQQGPLQTTCGLTGSPCQGSTGCPGTCQNKVCNTNESYASGPFDCTDGGSSAANACVPYFIDAFNGIQVDSEPFALHGFDWEYRSSPSTDLDHVAV